MNIRRLQGAALIISAVINLVGLLGSGTSAVRILFVIGALLLIFGVPAIESVQQAGMLDWAGIALIELKAVEKLLPVHDAQLLSYLKLSGKRLGFLLNFNVPVMKNGISRFVL